MRGATTTMLSKEMAAAQSALWSADIVVLCMVKEAIAHTGSRSAAMAAEWATRYFRDCGADHQSMWVFSW